MITEKLSEKDLPSGVYDMKYLLEIAAAVAAKTRHEAIAKTARDRKAEIEGEIDKLTDEDREKILGCLFPYGIASKSSFYDELNDFQHYVGYGDACYAFVGGLWAEAYNALPQKEQKVLLDEVFEDEGRGVWRAMHYLPEFCRRVEIEPEFAAGWFYRFGDEVRNDMANWDFFNGVKNYAFNFPGSGLKVFETYMADELDELKITLGAFLLGTVRSRAADGHFQKSVVERWDKQLRTDRQVERRLVYHRSLARSFDLGTLRTEGLSRGLSRMLKGEPQEVSEAFGTVWICLRSERADTAFAQFAMKWLSKHASGSLPDLAKHHIVDAMWYFRTPGKQRVQIEASEADGLILAVQPIPVANRVTWGYVEQYLIERLGEDAAAFEALMGRLVDANPEGVLVNSKVKRSIT